MDLHAKIMNIQVDEETIKKCIIKEIEKLPYWAITEDMEMDYIRKDFVKEILQKIYNLGHRDARHKAAELLLETEEKG